MLNLERKKLTCSIIYLTLSDRKENIQHIILHFIAENPITPVICLRSSSPLIITEFNPRNPPMLISGLMSGQVCNWDIRIGDRPVQMSHRQFSHRYLSIFELGSSSGLAPIHRDY